jgi:2-polyprenyl-3-methyl-5-hydroxy-6-metoxy-1,4-benzoquinol methylase
MSRVQWLALACLIGCGGEKKAPAQEPAPKPTVQVAPTSDVPAGSNTPKVVEDPTLERDQNEYVEDVVAFMKTMTKEGVRERMKKGSAPLKDEWNRWETEGKMTPDRITAFYKQTSNYIFELAEWHLWVPDKRESDLALVDDLKKKAPKNVLDFGGGTGIMAILLARAGLDVTLADLDSTTLAFAISRAQRHDIKLKIWKSDLENAPPDKKYDVIMALDVLEHLPKDILTDVVDKLVKLKHAKTEIIMSAPFGRTAVHPMHLDADEHTHAQVKRLKTELPKE